MRCITGSRTTSHSNPTFRAFVRHTVGTDKDGNSAVVRKSKPYPGIWFVCTSWGTWPNVVELHIHERQIHIDQKPLVCFSALREQRHAHNTNHNEKR